MHRFHIKSNHGATRRLPNCRRDRMPNRAKSGVAVIGELFLDEIFADFGAYPKLGEEVFARRFRREF